MPWEEMETGFMEAVGNSLSRVVLQDPEKVTLEPTYM